MQCTKTDTLYLIILELLPFVNYNSLFLSRPFHLNYKSYELETSMMIDLIEKMSSAQERDRTRTDTLFFMILELLHIFVNYCTLFLSGLSLLHNKSIISYINPDVTLLHSVQMPLKIKVHVDCKSGVYK
jgi:hypothetical protein